MGGVDSRPGQLGLRPHGEGGEVEDMTGNQVRDSRDDPSTRRRRNGRDVDVGKRGVLVPS